MDLAKIAVSKNQTEMNARKIDFFHLLLPMLHDLWKKHVFRLFEGCKVFCRSLGS